MNNYIINNAYQQKEENQFSSKTEKLLNDKVLKKLTTLAIYRDSLYSISLKVADAVVVDSLPLDLQKNTWLITEKSAQHG